MGSPREILRFIEIVVVGVSLVASFVLSGFFAIESLIHALG